MTFVYFLNFLAQFEKCIRDKACRQHGEWNAGWITNQQAQAGILRQVTLLLWTFASFSQITKVLVASSTVWRVAGNTKPLGSHGTLFSLPWGTLDHLPFLRGSCPGICHFHEVRRLFSKGTTSESQKIKRRQLSPPLVGKCEQTDLRFSSHILFLNLWGLV